MYYLSGRTGFSSNLRVLSPSVKADAFKEITDWEEFFYCKQNVPWIEFGLIIRRLHSEEMGHVN